MAPKSTQTQFFGVFSQLQALTGDNGAKAVLHNPPISVVEIALPEAALDIDRVEDLSQLLKQV